MKAKELNALIGKLTKQNPDAEVYLGFPTLLGPQFDDPAIVQAQDGLYVLPQTIESNIEKNSGRAQVGEQVQKAHQNWQQGQQDDAA